MPHQNTAYDQLLAMRRQEQDLAQTRHALTRREVRNQEKLLVELRQSRMAAVARLKWAADHGVSHLDAGEIVAQIDEAVANARRRLEWLRDHQQEEHRDLTAASERRELAEITQQRQQSLIERHGYALERRDGEEEQRKAAQGGSEEKP